MDDWVVKLRDTESKVYEVRREVRWKNGGGEMVERYGRGGEGDGFDVFVGGAGFERRGSYEDDEREERVVGVDELSELHHGNQVAYSRRWIQNHRRRFHIFLVDVFVC